MKKVWTTILLCSAFVLLGITGIYALPKVYILYQANTGKVDIQLSEYMRKDGKEVPWKNQENVLPGRFISKIPRIKNEGAECYVRAKVSFLAQNQSERPLDWQAIEGMDSNWIQEGEYFYYTKSMKPGETIDLFQGIQIPAEWKSQEEENKWEADVRVEAVQAECFAPDFTKEDPWGMKIRTFEVQQALDGKAQIQEGETEQLELCIADKMQGFTMEQEGCMKNLGTFVPGKEQTGSVKLKNGTELQREVFFWAESQELNELMKKMELTVLLDEKDGKKILYQGQITEDMLEERLSLGKFAPKEEKEVLFTYKLPEDADNTYTMKKGQVKFWFTTGEPESRKIVTAVSTGDSQKMEWYIFYSGLSAGILLLLLKKGSKDVKG